MTQTRYELSGQTRDVKRLWASLPEGPPPVARPVMVVISGLPGSGKTYFGRMLRAQLPLIVLESDALRKTLFPSPRYTSAENARLFSDCHSLIFNLLKRGNSILFDATNLIEGHRGRLYHIADTLEIKMVLVQLHASPEVVYERLKGRSEGIDPEDNSGADWEVYQRMLSKAEPINRKHFVVDTSKDISPALAKIVREINVWTRTA